LADRRLEAVAEVDKRGGESRAQHGIGNHNCEGAGIVRAERLRPVLDRRGGRIVNLTGDGALIEFVSAVEALSANIEFQQATTDTESQRPEAKRLVFRVGLGLHLVNNRPGPTAAHLL